MSGGTELDFFLELLREAHYEQSPDARDATLMSLMYRTPGELPPLIAEVEANLAITNRSKKDIEYGGKLMERVGTVAMLGVCSRAEIQSFCSATAQYDVLGTSDTLRWHAMRATLGMATGAPTLFAECKAMLGVVDDAGFARVCSIMTDNYPKTVGMAVFFAWGGASGFPTPKTPKRALAQARARQVMFYASTRRPIVVIDKHDLRALANGANFVQMLNDKRRDIEELSGRHVGPDQSPEAKDRHLPKHLRDEAAKVRRTRSGTST